jgi:hypothetical protein
LVVELVEVMAAQVVVTAQEHQGKVITVVVAHLVPVVVVVLERLALVSTVVTELQQVLLDQAQHTVVAEVQVLMAMTKGILTLTAEV